MTENKTTKERKKIKTCDVLYQRDGVVAILFDVYGVDVRYEKSVGSTVKVEYKGEIGLPNFECKIVE